MKNGESLKTNPNKVRIHVDFMISISILILIITIALDAFYYLHTGLIPETLIFVAATGAAAAGILAAFYVGRTLRLQLEQHASDKIQRTDAVEFQKKMAAFQFAWRWNDPSMNSARRTCRKIANMRRKGGDDVKSYLSDARPLDDAIHMLNYLEEVSLGVNREIVDGNLTKDFFEEIFDQIWKTLELWILDYRSERKAYKMWIEFEKLNKKWNV